jgi:hypothetical protein
MVRTGKRAQNSYPKRIRDKCAALYLELGSYQKVSDATGIPHATVGNWALSEQWRETIARLQAETDAEQRAQFREIVRRANDEVLDRLENGDHMLHARTGELVRVPMRGKDTMITASIAVEKLRLAEGRPTQITATTDALSRAAEAFNTLASQYRSKVVSEQ